MPDRSPVDRLRLALSRHSRIAVAVSGGVDSMTLAHVAHEQCDALMLHAVSPAVPAEATRRVERFAKQFGWTLKLTDAGEFSDPDYRANPVNRCYFCKSNLYRRLGGLTDRVIASGTNRDDLGDYRPGLIAAAENDVVHPFVEAEITKAELRVIARDRGLADLSVLPAQPCLSSRVETGIAIRERDLRFIEVVEAQIRSAASGLENVRCRIVRDGVLIEMDGAAGEQEVARTIALTLAGQEGRSFVGVRPYRQGSAFLRQACAPISR